MQPKGIYKGYIKWLGNPYRHTVLKCSMKLYLKVIGCSCYTCLPRTALKMARGTGTDASLVAQRLLTIATPKQCTIIGIQENTNKN